MTFVRRQWFSLTAGLLCFAWAFLGWLTAIPNQDILADGIQVQSILADPRIVLAFPGQKHGGPLEYPFTLLAEWLAPGNYFANAAVRPLLAFLTGFLVAKLFLTLFPKATKWAILVAIAVGPTIIHGLLGPEGNTVGVWWLQPNWDMAWLLVTAGALLLARQASKERFSWALALAGGVCIGLGFYAHPAITLLIVPLLVLVVLRTVPSPRVIWIGVIGVGVGILPAALSYVVNAKVNTWDPSHGAFISTDYYRSMGGAVLGLTGIPDYMLALLPYGLGLAPSTGLLSGVAQSVLMWIFICVVTIVAIVTSVRAIRSRQRVSAAGAVALAWVAAIATMLAFITFVDPVWIYSSGLAILFWLSIGSLPVFIHPRWLGNTITAVVIAIVGLSTINHNFDFYSDIPHRISLKIEDQSTKQSLAAALQAEGALFVFGSYYDAIPIGYTSGSELRTITNHYNRFPLTAEEIARPHLIVAVNVQPTDPWGDEAVQTVEQYCSPVKINNGNEIAPYGLFDCPGSALVFNK